MLKPLACDIENTTVVDVTYLCNARCNYCQWGSNKTPGKLHSSLEDVLIESETLQSLGTKRIVISGGEPTLHPDLPEILGYFGNLVEHVIVITNGYSLTPKMVESIKTYGATGLTVSLDSVDPGISLLTRRTPEKTHNRLLSRLLEMSRRDETFELGINAVVSHPTCNWKTVKDLLNFGSRIEADFVKFQPVFDDGYVKKNAPHLRLSELDAHALEEIADSIHDVRGVATNPSQFWYDIKALVQGVRLEPQMCGLGSRHSMLVHGELKICYWLDESRFKLGKTILSSNEAIETRSAFEIMKSKCLTGEHCFCNQNISHKWNRNIE